MKFKVKQTRFEKKRVLKRVKDHIQELEAQGLVPLFAPLVSIVKELGGELHSNWGPALSTYSNNESIAHEWYVEAELARAAEVIWQASIDAEPVSIHPDWEPWSPAFRAYLKNTMEKKMPRWKDLNDKANT